MQYFITMFLIFIIIFLISFVSNILYLDENPVHKKKDTYSECLDEIAIVDEAINNAKSEEASSEGELEPKEAMITEDDNIEDEKGKEIEEKKQGNEKKDKGISEKIFVSTCIEKSLADVSRNSALFLLFICIMFFILEGIDFMLGFNLTVNKGYIILLTTFYLLVMSKIIIKPIISSFVSNILENLYLKQGIEENKIQVVLKENEYKVNLANFACIFLVSLLVYFLIANMINLGDSLITACALALTNIIAYKCMFEIQYEN